MMKRCISIALVFVLVVSMLPIEAKAAMSGTCGDNLTWSLDGSGTLTISGTGKMNNYVAVDSNQDGINDATNAPWFGLSFNRLVIKEGATCVTMYSFAYNDTLETAILPDSLKTVNGYSFYQCTALQSIIIPNYATYIGKNAFAHCTALSSVQISANISEIDEGAFENCRSLQKIHFLYNRPLIADNVFAGVTAEAFYPSDKESWVSDTPTGFGGAITWSAYTPPLAIVIQPTDDTCSLYEWFDFDITLNRNDVHYQWQYSIDGTNWESELDLEWMRRSLSLRMTNENLHWLYRCRVTTYDGEEVFSNVCRIILKPSTGKCGDHVSWEFKMDASALILSGSGDTWNYDTSSVTSWNNLYSEITYVHVGSGITSIGDRLFDECYKMKYMILPDSLTRIGDSSFNFCYLLETIYFAGTQERWDQITIGSNNHHLKYVNVYFESSGPGTGYIGIEAKSRHYPVMTLDDHLWESADFPFNSGEWDCLIHTNKVRYKEGIAPLTSYPLLHEAAAVRKEEIITAYDHKRPDGSSCFTVLDDFGITYETAGENLAVAVGTGENAVNAWMRSPEHRSNLLSFSHIGIGYNGYSWVQLFIWNYGDLYVRGDFSFPDNLHIPAGASLDDLNLYTTVNTYMYDNCYIPIISEYFSNYNPNQVGKQTVTVSFLCYSEAFDIYVDFADTLKGSFYYTPVLWAVENNITTGTSDTTFSPAASCNRAQAVTFLWAAAGKPEPTITEHSFVDVPKGSFCEKAVLWAVEKGITTGTDETHFSPLATCNRATIVTFLYNAFNSPEVSAAENPFEDVPDESWYTAPVLWAKENGITSGTDATHFSPASICNRAQIVTFLYGAYN